MNESWQENELWERFNNLTDKNATFCAIHNDIPNPDAWFRDVVMIASPEEAEALILELETYEG